MANPLALDYARVLETIYQNATGSLTNSEQRSESHVVTLASLSNMPTSIRAAYRADRESDLSNMLAVPDSLLKYGLRTAIRLGNDASDMERSANKKQMRGHLLRTGAMQNIDAAVQSDRIAATTLKAEVERIAKRFEDETGKAVDFGLAYRA
ncbi:hypothetical protein LTR15_012832 [Elasticomyces elasticus]|nr:hypothetical protein LTR15_012832 [Elasticomyces elasticus]